MLFNQDLPIWTMNENLGYDYDFMGEDVIQTQSVF